MSNDAEAIQQFISQDTDEWATPPQFVRPLSDAVGGFDLDPASGAERSPIASETFTEGDDGLSRPWFGSVWCNPPYSEMDAWVRKAIREYYDGVSPILLLCKGDSSTDWWQAAASEASMVAAIDGRLRFGDGDRDAPFPSHVIGFGHIPAEVKDVLDRRGVVFDAADRHNRTCQEELD